MNKPKKWDSWPPRIEGNVYGYSQVALNGVELILERLRVVVSWFTHEWVRNA